MAATDMYNHLLPRNDFFWETVEYLTDAGQKTILYLDILRERGNIFFEHFNQGKPPVLTFKYKNVMDGRSLARPVNHDLIQIMPKKGMVLDQGKRPIVVIDPRAGHGPGIGGSKLDSEIGMAMEADHPVYFITFFPEPCPGQTYADVEQAQTQFIEEVVRRHPKSGDPMIIGNCQAGWAVALLGADRPDITGPLVFNGSPLSYWAGVEGQNPIRYQGGLWGGVWAVSLLSDLNDGKFDGANLVHNFENLNPGNTLWTKQYNVWANVDTEAERYLDFEKWWNGYFFMTSEEIHFIISNLFIANKLEQGKLELRPGKKIDLKNLRDPVLVFASRGDNITPPQQALNWIASVYGTTDELKRLQQTIIYMLHEKVGHLGIFISGAVAKKEHRGIIQTADMLDYLPPGLYEMKIGEEASDLPGGINNYNVTYEEREMEDILALDDGQEDEKAFVVVEAVSEMNDKFYRSFISPWVRMASNSSTAEALRWIHPQRLSRYVYSDRNPLMWPVRMTAPSVRLNRKPVSPDNRFVALEKAMSDTIRTSLDFYRDVRDSAIELIFKSIYENPWVVSLFPVPEEQTPLDREKLDEKDRTVDTKKWMDAMETGGYPEGIVRIMVAMADADKIFDQREYDTAEKIIRENPRLRRVKPEALKTMVKEQSRILDTDMDKALSALGKLLPTKKDRKEAMEIAGKIAAADFVANDMEKVVMGKIKGIFAGG